jgi:Chemotaxis protein histidine kinase and related kinases
MNIRLPLTLAIIPCLVVVVDDFRYAIPQVNLEELVSLYKMMFILKLNVPENRKCIDCAGNCFP